MGWRITQAVVGGYNSSFPRRSSDGVDAGVLEIHVHPEYMVPARGSVLNDVAVLIIDQEFNATVELASEQELVAAQGNGSLLVAGW